MSQRWTRMGLDTGPAHHARLARVLAEPWADGPTYPPYDDAADVRAPRVSLGASDDVLTYEARDGSGPKPVQLRRRGAAQGTTTNYRGPSGVRWFEFPPVTIPEPLPGRVPADRPYEPRK